MGVNRNNTKADLKRQNDVAVGCKNAFEIEEYFTNFDQHLIKANRDGFGKMGVDCFLMPRPGDEISLTNGQTGVAIETTKLFQYTPKGYRLAHEEGFSVWVNVDGHIFHVQWSCHAAINPHGFGNHPAIEQGFSMSGAWNRIEPKAPNHIAEIFTARGYKWDEAKQTITWNQTNPKTFLSNMIMRDSTISNQLPDMIKKHMKRYDRKSYRVALICATAGLTTLLSGIYVQLWQNSESALASSLGTISLLTRTFGAVFLGV